MQRCVVAAMDGILPRSLAAGRRGFHRAFCAAAAASRGDPPPPPPPPPLPDAALLPHSVRGIISNYFDHYRPEWLVRPRGNGSPSISMPYAAAESLYEDAVRDHCNGLILYERDYGCECSLWVLNPATRRLAVLPPLEVAVGQRVAGAYLAFDPTVSLHYEVFLIPEVPDEPKGHRDGDEAPQRLHDDATLDGSAEWPPAVHRLQVYSSRSGLWEERAFVREGGGAVGTVAEARSDSVEAVYFGPYRRYAACWRGALYVHCRGAYVMSYVDRASARKLEVKRSCPQWGFTRLPKFGKQCIRVSPRLSLLEDKYQKIKTPTNIREGKRINTYLGRSVKGVSYVVHENHELRVWTLDESRGEMEWVLEHHIDLKALYHQMPTLPYSNKVRNQPWAMLHYIIDKYDLEVQEASEWNSDDDDILEIIKSDTLEITKSNLKRDKRVFKFLGFHPYKEVMFLRKEFNVVTYHLTSSKAQYLGNAYPHDYEWSPWATIEESFTYTPCLVDSLPKDDISILEPMDREETPMGPSI